MPSFDGDDRRGDPRHTVNREFQSIDEFVQDYVMNISRTGVFIKTRKPLPIGTEVKLHFTILADDPHTIEGIGRVVRSISPEDASKDNPAGMGVVFTELTSYSLEILEKLITRTG